MPPNPQTSNGFTETAELPRGRKARQVPQDVLNVLEDSAKRGVGFAKTAAPNVIDELRRDLGSAAVRAKYEVTVSTEKLSDKSHKLTFSARAKDTASDAEIPPVAASALCARRPPYTVGGPVISL